MANASYETIGAEQSRFPPRSLLVVRTGDKAFTSSLEAFGPGTYNENIAEMQKSYSHPKTGERISFRPATTDGSLLIVTCDFANQSKPQIFDKNWLQAGRIVKAQEGVFVNTSETDEEKLRSLLNGAEKVNRIYLGENEFGFAPYDTFERGVQDAGKFVEGGLARVLEHTPEKAAENLGAISDPKLYELGVNVWGFGEVNKPVKKVVSLFSNRYANGNRLYVDGYDWDDYYGGFAFGVLNESAEGSSQKFK